MIYNFATALEAARTANGLTEREELIFAQGFIRGVGAVIRSASPLTGQVDFDRTSALQNEVESFVLAKARELAKA